MSIYTQADRQLQIKSPLGDNVLILEGFSGVEGLSEPFLFHLSLRSERDWIDPKDIVGQPVAFGIRLAWPKGTNPRIRWFHGVVRRFVYRGGTDRLSRYAAEVVPQAWFLNYRMDARIYQEQSTPDIVKKVIDVANAGTLDVTGLSSRYPAREYCVQYHETEHAFIGRLLEEEGIFYRYQRGEDGHSMILGDGVASYAKCLADPLRRMVPFHQNHGEDDLLSWEHAFDFQPGRWVMRDYNFKTPGDSMQTKRELSTPQPAGASYEVFHYPGGYRTKEDGRRLTQTRMQTDDCRYDVVIADTVCPDLLPGGRFKVGAHPVKGERDREWLVVSVEHAVHSEGELESGSGSPATYVNRVTCIPAEIVYRPPRRTPRPLMYGIQTAVVVGPEGEEIYVDKFGRVKVRFHWDRHAEDHDRASCWIRVSQPWAGTTYGGLAIPRIGQEVVVEFEEGNPDRPLINGRVYNATQQVPVTNAGRPGATPADLTAAAMMTTIRSNSLGKTGGFNELTMDDTKDRETLFLQAQKDNLNKIKNDQSTVIGNDRKESVGKSHTEVIGTDYTLTVGKTLTETVDGDAAISIKKNRTETVGADSTMKVKGNETTSIGGAVKIEIGKDLTVSVGGSGKLQVTKKHEISAEEIVIKAMKKIEIAVGTSKIVLEPSQLTIQGTMIATKASAINEVKGALVKINC